MVERGKVLTVVRLRQDGRPPIIVTARADDSERAELVAMLWVELPGR